VKRRLRSELSLLVAGAAAALGCSSSEPRQADYKGVAYPNDRPSFDRRAGRIGYVANRNDDTVSVLDLDAMKLLGTVPVGRDPVDIDGPRHVVLDTENDLAYIALSYPFSEQSPHALIEGGTQRAGYVEALDLDDLSVMGDLRVDPSANELAFSPSLSALAVSHYDVFRALSSENDDRRANLVLVDPARDIALDDATARRSPLCAVPAAMAFSADGSRLFVACTGDDALVVVDPRTEKVLSSVKAGEFQVNKPYALVADSARGRVLLSNQVTKAVSVFDMSDEPAMLASLPVLGPPMFPVWLSDSTIAVPFQQPSGVSLFDLSTNQELLQALFPIEDCENAAELSLTSDGRLLLVCEGTHYQPGSVVELDPATLEIRAKVAVGVYPERMAISEP